MRVLIVEDEQDLQNILVKRLNAEHYSVDACGMEKMPWII